jgi:hypothetical protein
MAAPLGVLPACPAAATTKVEDVDGGPPGRCCWHVRQRLPPKLKTLMAGPLGGADDRSGNGHHRSWRCLWRAPWGVLPVSPTLATIGPHQ